MNAEIRKLTISTLSPVHIGCGEDFEPGNFVIHEGLLHALDVETLAAELTPEERKQLGTLANDPNPIGKIQAFFSSKAERLAAVSVHQVSVVSGIAREYAQKMGRATQQAGAGAANVFNQFLIERTVWQPLNNAAYLPGSSLKGSIRTAWLNRANQGNALTSRQESNTTLQQRLLDYSFKELHKDPFRLLALSDARNEDEAPPTRILYAISKKKRQSERSASEIKVYREAIAESLPAAFAGEMRFLPRKTAAEKDITWNALCDACNEFYGQKLGEELRDNFLGPKLEADWRKLINELLGQELDTLIKARQGFLLRVGRHSGAESVTLDGVRNIKIMGKAGEKPSYRPLTTEKRFATNDKANESALLPFGWIWVDASEGQYVAVHDSFRQKLASHSEKMRESHRERLLANELRRAELQQKAQAEAAKKQAEREAEAQQEREAAEKAAQLAAMTPAMREIAEFREAFEKRYQALQESKGSRDKPFTAFYNTAKALADKAHAEGWTPEEKISAADAIEAWLPKVVAMEPKEIRKRLNLTALRGLQGVLQTRPKP